MSDISFSHSLIIGHDLLDDDETYLQDLSDEELGSISGGALIKTGPVTTAINCTVPFPTKTGVVTTAISCTCHPGPKPTPPEVEPGPKPTPPVVIDPCVRPITTAWFCTRY
jgi:hypothetical protein